ncbi:MAG TPA: cache domain-containing protein [Methanocorpusculum sp.]|nr:cache domain-containing protein [Methanocorpusculum sp.]
MTLCLVIGIIFITGCVMIKHLEPISDEKQADMQSSLDELIPTLDEQLNEIFILTNNRASNLTGSETGTAALDQAMLQLRRDIPASYEVLFVDTDNICLAITGKSQNHELIGKPTCVSITEADFTNTINGCIITEPITFITGDRGVLTIAPIYNESGIYNGSLRVSLNPTYLFSGAASKIRSEGKYTIWAIQPNGVQIYDEKIRDIDKNALTDPMYLQMTAGNGAQRVAEEKQGNLSCMYQRIGSIEFEQANAVWKTIVLTNGIEWRIILVDNANTGKNTETQLTIDQLKTFVEKAYIYTQTHTKEESVRAFNDPKGTFIDGELYIFAYDMTGMTLALPYQQNIVGTTRWNGEDVLGVKVLQRFIDKSKFGGGFVYYQYPNPNDNFASELKLSYVMSVDENWLIGAGIYPATITPNYTWEKRNQLVTQVRGFQYLSTMMPEEDLWQMINDPTSELQIEGLCPFALDGNGNVLSCICDPTRVGTNWLGSTNSYGMSPVREIISLGRSGGGLMYSLVEGSAPGIEEYMIIYVEPADGEIYYGSMMRLDGT